MDRYWRQGLVVSLLIHALILGVGGFWGLMRQADLPESDPVRARLVVAQSKSAQPKQRAETASQSGEVQGADTSETLQESQPLEAAAQAKAATSGAAAKPEPAASAKVPKRPEAQVQAEPKKPPIKEPEQGVLKEKVATEVSKPPSRPAQTDQSETEVEKVKKQETEPKKRRRSRKKGAREKPSEAPKEPGKESEPLLGESLAQKIAQAAKEGGNSRKRSLSRQRAVARFQEIVRNRIQQRWLVSPGLENRSDLEATVRLVLTPSGELAAPPRIIASNGPGHFNSSVLRAVKKAAPFPMPDGPTQYFQNLELHFSPDMVQ